MSNETRYLMLEIKFAGTTKTFFQIFDALPVSEGHENKFGYYPDDPEQERSRDLSQNTSFKKKQEIADKIIYRYWMNGNVGLDSWIKKNFPNEQMSVKENLLKIKLNLDFPSRDIDLFEFRRKYEILSFETIM